MADHGWTLLLSCEHAANRVPQRWKHLFAGNEAVLTTHRGYDLGIAPFARRLSTQLKAPLHTAEVSRLLIEVNRSLGHRALFSEFSRPLGARERDALLAHYYHPYRERVVQHIHQILAGRKRRVCHISLHSFAPELHGKVRDADIGLLYDPTRRLEKAFCMVWHQTLTRRDAGWRVRRNYPYRGTADGFVTHLRRCFPEERYLGLELELNQHWPLLDTNRWKILQQLVCTSLESTLDTWRCGYTSA